MTDVTDDRIDAIVELWSIGAYKELGDLLAIPFDDDGFDLVLASFGAFTADDPVACMRELLRVCRPGGSIVTTARTHWVPFPSPAAALDFTETASGPVQRLRDAVQDTDDDAWDEVRRLTLHDWAARARAAGEFVELPLSYVVATIEVAGADHAGR